MPELLEILCDERTPGLSLERSKIFGNVWRCIVPEDLSDHEKISQLIWSRRWLDALRGDILRVLTSLGKSTNRLATHKEVMLEDDDEIAVTSIMDSKMQKAWVKTVRDDLIKACTVLEENAIMAGENMSEEAAKNQSLARIFRTVLFFSAWLSPPYNPQKRSKTHIFSRLVLMLSCVDMICIGEVDFFFHGSFPSTSTHHPSIVGSDPTNVDPPGFWWIGFSRCKRTTWTSSRTRSIRPCTPREIASGPKSFGRPWPRWVGKWIRRSRPRMAACFCVNQKPGHMKQQRGGGCTYILSTYEYIWCGRWCLARWEPPRGEILNGYNDVKWSNIKIKECKKQIEWLDMKKVTSWSWKR